MTLSRTWELPAALPPFRGAVLDMDGLVLDTEAAYSHAWQCAAAELGFQLSGQFCRSLFGRHADDVKGALRKALGEQFEPKSFHEAAERSWRRFIQNYGIARMAGLETLLAVLRHRAVPYALATNSDGIYARECLRRAGIESEFPIVVTRDLVARGKPEPDLFLEAARLLGVSPAACLALDDSETGLAGAAAANTIPVLIQRDDHRRAELAGSARFSFASLTQLAQVIEDMGKPLSAQRTQE